VWQPLLRIMHGAVPVFQCKASTSFFLRATTHFCHRLPSRLKWSACKI
jgi:hypothetical protein